MSLGGGSGAHAQEDTGPAGEVPGVPLAHPDANPPDWLYTPAGWDAEWQEALRTADTAPVWLTVLGDSISAGAVALDFVNTGWVGLLRSRFSAAYPMRGDFWMPTASDDYMPDYRATPPPFTLAEGPHTWYGWGYSRLPVFLNGASEIPLRFTSPYACTELEVVYADVNAGAWEFRVDAGPWQHVTTTGSRTAQRVYGGVLADLPLGVHTVEFGRQTDQRVMLVQGVSAFSGVVGIGVGRVTTAGGSVADYAATEGIWPADMPAMWSGRFDSPPDHAFPTRPHLGIVALGINDCQQATLVDVYRATLLRLIQAFRNGRPGGSVLLLAEANPTAGMAKPFRNAGQWPAYVDTLKTVAMEQGCALVNFDQRWAELGGLELGFYTPDQPHPTDAGHADIAAVLGPLLGAAA